MGEGYGRSSQPWQLQQHPTATPGGLQRLQPAAVSQRDRLSNREAETVMIRPAAGGIGLPETLEHQRPLIGRNPWPLIVHPQLRLLPLIGVVLNGTSSALYATIGDLVEPEKLPRAFGLFYTLGSCCGLIAPLLLGALGDKIGVADAMIVTALLAFLTLPACMVLRPALQSLRA